MFWCLYLIEQGGVEEEVCLFCLFMRLKGELIYVCEGGNEY